MNDLDKCPMRGISCKRDKCINCQKGTDRTKVMIDNRVRDDLDHSKLDISWVRSKVQNKILDNSKF